MIKYTHTNIIAKDAQKIIKFYKEVLGCKSMGQKRDLKGEWVDKLTGIENAHIVGEHLCLPGYEEKLPTLEIFSYESMEDSTRAINKCGISHLAFEVDDVEKTLQLLLQNGGEQLGAVVKTKFADGRTAVLVYATDCEGNIVELQSFSYEE